MEYIKKEIVAEKVKTLTVEDAIDYSKRYLKFIKDVVYHKAQSARHDTFTGHKEHYDRGTKVRKNILTTYAYSYRDASDEVMEAVLESLNNIKISKSISQEVDYKLLVLQPSIFRWIICQRCLRSP